MAGRIAGTEADWLHNLAECNSIDFEGFDERLFWQEFENILKSHDCIEKYKRIFENYLNGEIQIV